MQEISEPSLDHLLDIAEGGYAGVDAFGSLLPGSDVPMRCANPTCTSTEFVDLGGRMVCACGYEPYQVCTVSSAGLREFEVEKRASATARNEELFGAYPIPATTLTPLEAFGDCDACLAKVRVVTLQMRTKAVLILAALEHLPCCVAKRAVVAEAMKQATRLVANCEPVPGSVMAKTLYKDGRNNLTPAAVATAARLHAWSRSKECAFLRLADAFPAAIPPATFSDLKKAAGAMHKLVTSALKRMDDRVRRLRQFGEHGDVKALRDDPPSADDAGLGIVRPRKAMGVNKGVVAQSMSESFVACIRAYCPTLATDVVAAARGGNARELNRLANRVRAVDVAGVARAAADGHACCCDSAGCRTEMCIGFSGFVGSGTKASSIDGGETLKNMWNLELRLLPLVFSGLRASGWDEAAIRSFLQRRTKARYFGSPFYEARASRTVTAAFCLMQEVPPPPDVNRDEQRSTLARRVSVCSAALVHGIYEQFIAPVLQAVHDPAEYLAAHQLHKARFDNAHGSGEVDGMLLARLIMHYQACDGHTRECDGVAVPMATADPHGGTSVADFNAFVSETLAKASAAGKSGRARSMGLLRRKEHTTLDFDGVLRDIRNGVLGSAGSPWTDPSANASNTDLRPCKARVDAGLLNKVVASFATRFQLADPVTFAAYLGVHDEATVVARFGCHPLALLFTAEDAAGAAAAVAAAGAAGAAGPSRSGGPTAAGSARALQAPAERRLPVPAPPASQALRVLAAGVFKGPQQQRAKSPIRECEAGQAAQRFGTTPEVIRSTLGVMHFLLVRPSAALDMLKESIRVHGASVDNPVELLRELTLKMLAQTLPEQAALLHKRHVVDFLCHTAWRWGVGRIQETLPTSERDVAFVVARQHDITKRGPNDAAGADSPKRRRV